MAAQPPHAPQQSPQEVLQRFDEALTRVEQLFAELAHRQEQAGELIAENRQLELELKQLRARADTLAAAARQALQRVEQAMALVQRALHHTQDGRKG